MALFDTLRAVAKQAALEQIGLAELPTREELEQSKAALATLAENCGDVKAFNHALIHYIAEFYPSRAADLDCLTASRPDDIPRVFDREMDNLFLIQSAMKSVEDGRIELIKQKKNPIPQLKRNDLKAVYSVVNDKVYERHLKYLDENPGADIKCLYHCSLNENWAGIIADGLKSRPQGVHITGKSLGEGVYFMDDVNDMREGFLSRTGSFTEDEFVNARFFGVYEAALTPNNYNSRGGEICVYHEDAVYLRYLVELWAV